MIKIRAFRAIDDKNSCQAYINGHRKLLISYGVAEVVAPNYDWAKDPGAYVIIVENIETGKTLGGARIQVRGTESALPLEDAVGKMDEKIYTLVQKYAEKGTAEFCGLWNSREVAGLGIGSVLLVRAGVARAGVAIAEYLNISSLFAFCASYTLPTAQKAGFIVETSVGEAGSFPYPKDEFKAIVAINNELTGLKYATEEEKNEIFNLRENPVQERIQKGPRGETKVIYDLRISAAEKIRKENA